MSAHSPSSQAPKTPALPTETSEPNRIISRLAKGYLWPQRLPLGAAIACMLIVASTTALTAWLLEPAIRTIFIDHDNRMLMMIPLVILGVSATKAIAAYCQGLLMAAVARDIVKDMQKNIFSCLMHADIARLESRHTATHQTNFLQNTNMVAQSVSASFIAVFRDVPTMLGLVVVMFVMDWQLALFATVAAPIIALFTRKLAKSASRSMKGSIQTTDKLSKHISESLQGIRIVKAYGQENHEIARAGALIDERMHHFYKAQRAGMAAAPLTEALAGIGIAVVVFYGGLRGMNGSLELSEFMAFLAAMMWAFQPMRTLSNLVTHYAQGLRAAEAVFQEVDIQADIQEAPNAPAMKIAEINGATVRFENVSFDYGADIPALQNINLEAKPGQTIALVGPSGAGKTTVFNLLLRFYDVGTGKITIDGQDIRACTLATLRENIAIVAQDATLFDETVAANIAYGGTGSVQAAARLAAADEFINELPNGYETRIGEHGALLSGGQRQRIAIARAFLKDAPILLLDEATSALDTKSEARVQSALQALIRGRTTFVIAHRLSTILAADTIFVLEGGHVAEHGTHETLLANNGLYKSLYQSQFQKAASPSPTAPPELMSEA